MKSIVLQNFNHYGLCQSTAQANQNSLAEIAGIDLHSEGGVVKCSQAITEITGWTSNALVPYKILKIGTSIYYFCCQSDDPTNTGAIVEYAGGAFTIVHLTVKGIMDAFVEGVYLYYTMYGRLGRWDTTAAWATADDSWATLNDSIYHYVKNVNGTFYIADGNEIAQLEGGVFTSNALDLPAESEVTALGVYNTGLLIGAKSLNNEDKSKIYWWNTYSESYSFSDEIYEGTVNSFLSVDNSVMCNVGEKGRLYYFNGSQLIPFFRMNGNWDYDHRYKIRHNAVADLNGVSIFGLSFVGGDPVETDTKTVIYSLTKPTDVNRNVISGEFFGDGISKTYGNYSCIANIGGVLYVAGGDNATISASVVRILNNAKKQTSALETHYFRTSILNFGRLNPVKITGVMVHINSKPASKEVYTTVTANDGTLTINSSDFTYNTTKKCYISNSGLDNVYNMQIQCSFFSSVTSTNIMAEIEAIEVLYD